MKKFSWKKVFSLANIMILIMLVLYSRLVFLAVSPEIDGINMMDFAQKRNVANLRLPAKRGNIYDQNVLNLATAVSSYTVIAFLDETRTVNPRRPHHVIDKRMTAQALAPVLNMCEEYIYGLLNRQGYQVELGPGGRDISELKKREIEELNLPGISFIVKPSRHYPNGDFASYIIGYAKRYEEIVEDNGLRRINYEIVGELGIESKYNAILNGTDGRLIYQRDRFGHKIPDTPETRIEALDGHDIYLTIDSGIQRFLEAAVKDVNRVYRPEWIQISVMEAKTGRILGSATTPSYNPNTLNIVNYENPLISFLFEPGSTMKTYTYMCAMEHGLYDANKTFISGEATLFNQVIHDWERKGWGRISFAEGFRRSSNVGAFRLVEDLKPHELQECLLRYGFAQKTGVELARELNGRLPFTNQFEKANAAFGQGLTTTGIQHLQGLTIVANDGYMVKPVIIDRIYNPNTDEIVHQYEIKKEKIVEAEIAQTIKDLLYDVVHLDGGTGHLYRNSDMEIIGKTGTAQIFDNRLGRYKSGDFNYIYSFAGMFPYEDPEIIIYAAMKRPQHGRHLGMLYANIEIIDNIGKYLNLMAEEKEEIIGDLISLNSYVNGYVKDVVADLKDKGLKPIVLGDGTRVLEHKPQANAILLPNSRVLLLTDSLDILMPNFSGWSRRELLYFFDLVPLDYELLGFGFVKNQSIASGTLINEEEFLELELTNKIND